MRLLYAHALRSQEISVSLNYCTFTSHATLPCLAGVDVVNVRAVMLGLDGHADHPVHAGEDDSVVVAGMPRWCVECEEEG